MAATGEKNDADLVYYGFNNSTYFLILPSVTNRASRGSVPAPVLFNVFISDIAEGLLGKVGLFAEDTKVCDRVDIPGGSIRNRENDLAL